MLIFFEKKPEAFNLVKQYNEIPANFLKDPDKIDWILEESRNHALYKIECYDILSNKLAKLNTILFSLIPVLFVAVYKTKGMSQIAAITCSFFLLMIILYSLTMRSSYISPPYSEPHSIINKNFLKNDLHYMKIGQAMAIQDCIIKNDLTIKSRAESIAIIKFLLFILIVVTFFVYTPIVADIVGNSKQSIDHQTPEEHSKSPE